MSSYGKLFGISGIIGKKRLLNLMCILLRATKGGFTFHPVDRGR